MTKTTLFLLDDHQMLIDGIKALVKREKGIEVLGEATSALKAIELIQINPPDIVLTDINMPEMNGIEFTRKLLAMNSKIKIITLSMFGEKSMISEMLDAGVSGYILKNTGKKELMNAIEKVANGGMFFSEEVSAEMMKAISERNISKNLETTINLTEREKEIIKLIANEHSNAKIGEILFISERTVESHRKNIFRKTGTKTIVGLIKYCIENKLTD